MLRRGAASEGSEDGKLVIEGTSSGIRRREGRAGTQMRHNEGEGRRGEVRKVDAEF